MAVSESDPNVIYVGGGEKTVRGNVSHGDGVWKSTDAGKTWKHVGLADTRHIPRIRIHPKNPDLVYVAALGHLFGPNKERGVYRSKDGGATWKQVLFVNDEVGAVDLALDPTNPRVLYASTWRVKRTPYSLESGGPGSGLWKSTDGGDTWTEITKNKGLPQGTVGIIGVTVSPVDSERVWAIVEADDGGVFRSDDGGKTWTQDQRRPQPPPARLVLHAHLRRPRRTRTKSTSSTSASGARPTAARRFRRSARRTATTTTCGSTRRSRRG